MRQPNVVFGDRTFGGGVQTQNDAIGVQIGARVPVALGSDRRDGDRCRIGRGGQRRHRDVRDGNPEDQPPAQPIDGFGDPLAGEGDGHDVTLARCHDTNGRLQFAGLHRFLRMLRPGDVAGGEADPERCDADQDRNAGDPQQ